MVVSQLDDPATDRIMQALSDATRRDILRVVLRDEASVSTLARRYPMSFAAVQKHVAVLERAGLVTKRRQGREQRVRGQVDTIRETGRLLDELEALWRTRLEQFTGVLADQQSDRPTDHPSDHLSGRTKGATP